MSSRSVPISRETKGYGDYSHFWSLIDWKVGVGVSHSVLFPFVLPWSTMSWKGFGKHSYPGSQVYSGVRVKLQYSTILGHWVIVVLPQSFKPYPRLEDMTGTSYSVTLNHDVKKFPTQSPWIVFFDLYICFRREVGVLLSPREVIFQMSLVSQSTIF